MLDMVLACCLMILTRREPTSSCNSSTRNVLTLNNPVVVIAFSAPLFIFPGLFVALGGFGMSDDVSETCENVDRLFAVFGQVYMKAQLAVKRERSNAKVCRPFVPGAVCLLTCLVSPRFWQL
jgi:hypothetical protein